MSALSLPWDARLIAEWGITHGLRVVVILVAAIVLHRLGTAAIATLQHRSWGGHSGQDLEWQRRSSTLGGILTRLVSVVIAFLAMMMVLRELSIDVVPILTGAGIAGLAVGFGAQNLVRDVISGFFLILEDQVRVGDLARINGTTGSIEQVNLRTLVIRDGEGAVHVFPNGTVTQLANLSKQFAYAVVDIRVSYDANLDRVFEAIQEVGAAMQTDPQWSPLLLAPIENLGVDSLIDNFAIVKTKFKTLPLNQGRVASELRRRLMVVFAKRAIKPYAP
jgi:small-conductance mechanosensitive channel